MAVQCISAPATPGPSHSFRQFHLIAFLDGLNIERIDCTLYV